MRSTIALVLLSWIGTAVLCAATPPILDSRDVTILPMSWDIEVFPGQPVTVLNGTIEEAYAQALTINPDFKPPVAAAESNTTLLAAETGHLAARNTRVECNPNSQASMWRIQQGITYLRGRAFKSGNKIWLPTGRVCQRISCSYGAAIYACSSNLDPEGTVINGWQTLLNSIGHLYNMCHNDDKHTVGGVNYEDSRWYTKIDSADC